MGYTTDFIGHIDISPSLNDEEIAYLSAFSQSRRFARAGGPYDVPGNPRAEVYSDFDRDAYNENAPGQPGLWCDWVPCWHGCCVAYNGNEKFYQPTRWLRYLIMHFLKPGAAASRSGDACFAGFTFDHVLGGNGDRVSPRQQGALRHRHAIDRRVEDSPRRRRRRDRDRLAPVVPLS